MSDLKTKNHNLDPKSNIRYRAYKFSLTIIKLIQGFPNEKIYWTISDQLLRSATSIGANIIEAKSSSSKKDFINFYHIALKSANEAVYWLYLLRDSNLIEESKISFIINESKEINNMLGASLLTMKRKKF